MPVRAEKPEAANAADDPDYQPRDAVGETLRSSTVLAGAGLITSAVQASLAKRNVGTFGALTRYGGNIGLFGMMHHPKSNSLLIAPQPWSEALTSSPNVYLQT